VNRQIKFRGKRIDDGTWVYGSYQADVMCLNKHTIIYSDNEGFYCEDEVIPETVGQFTDLHDRNGKEIWEGDLFKIDGHWDTYNVTMKNGCFGLEGLKGAPFKPLFVALKEHDDFPLTHLGSIYEHPELLC
jgi:hypothetical protein